MTLNQFSGSGQTLGQMNPMKTLESFYSAMMPIWAVTSNAFENQKKLHEELIELMQAANERLTDRVVEAIDHNKPNELMAAVTIACQAFGQTNLTIYNAMAEQHHQFMDSFFQIIDKGRQQVYKDASQI